MKIEFDAVVTGAGYCERSEAAVWGGHRELRQWMREEMKASKTHTKVSAYTKDYYIWLYRDKPMSIFKLNK